MSKRNPNLSNLLDDPYLQPYADTLARRAADISALEQKLCYLQPGIEGFACAHEYYGLHLREGRWIFRELAPNATAMWLVGDFSGWKRSSEFEARRIEERGVWELSVPADKISHGQLFHLEMEWPGGSGERIPAYARVVKQDPVTNIFAALVWEPETPYVWQNDSFSVPDQVPLIYEAHIGMAQEEPGVGTYREFRDKTLPRIAKAGYNTIQLMAVMEHPYYGSFGYQVSSFFACSSRFGTPEELKDLVDAAHDIGIAVIMDLVHSHAVRNEMEGLSMFDGTPYLYFHDGGRGWHDVWNSRCFDYGKIDTLHFLLSNCRYWLDEFRFDGFRFDGVTSMLCLHHGIGVDFTDYSQYFDSTVDESAFNYLALANTLIHKLRPDAITIAEDVSGMPGLAAPREDFGAGFDYRLAMGVPECWFKLVRDVRDEDWSLGYLWYELTNRRADEQTVNYVESHDQALVGGKTLFFEMAGAAVYDSMHNSSENIVIDRAVALHKMIRLLTLGTVGNGYLNFMGNEFGHPEWIDFPREGNGFSFEHARRLWSLRDNPGLRFHGLANFDAAMIYLFRKTRALFRTEPKLLVTDELGKVIAFARGDLFIIANLHSTESHADFPVVVPPGEYELMLDTDSESFGGQNRIMPGQTYSAEQTVKGSEKVYQIRVYIPARTAVVLRRSASAL